MLYQVTDTTGKIHTVKAKTEAIAKQQCKKKKIDVLKVLAIAVDILTILKKK